MNPQTQQLLSQLQDIQIPDAVGWWPLSQTLIGIFAGLGGILIGLTWYYLTQRRHNQYRREALTIFDQTVQKADTPQQKLRLAIQLLKQVAITNYGRRRVAPLYGDSWVAFLHQTALYIEQPDTLKTVLQSAYSPSLALSDAQIEETLIYIQNWIKGHHK